MIALLKRLFHRGPQPEYCITCGARLYTERKVTQYDPMTGKPFWIAWRVACYAFDCFDNRDHYCGKWHHEKYVAQSAKEEEA